MLEKRRFTGRKLLLMGSKAFKEKELPLEVKDKIDEAMVRQMTVIVGEALGACRLDQDYLKAKGYDQVIVGHARSMRYNAGNWKTVKYGDNLKEREKNMIKDADSALIIWADRSSVIAENLERLKRRGTPTFLYEYDNETGTNEASWLDPEKIYDSYYEMKKYWKKKKKQQKKVGSKRSNQR